MVTRYVTVDDDFVLPSLVLGTLAYSEVFHDDLTVREAI